MPSNIGVTEDKLLGGRISLLQNATGYRVAIDPILLAASIPAIRNDTILDVGAGAGAAMLCLAQRVAGVNVTGVELQRSLVHLANENIKNNGFQEQLQVMLGDLQHPPPRLVPRSFHHVMANPPYFEANRVRASYKEEKSRANIEGSGGLSAWVQYCLSMVKLGGTITIIHRADRFSELLHLLSDKAGDSVIFPFWPHNPFEPGDNKEINNKIPVYAKRIIVQAVAGSKGPIKFSSGLVLHKTGGNLTKSADDILRNGKPLIL